MSFVTKCLKRSKQLARWRQNCCTFCTTEQTSPPAQPEVKRGGYAKAFSKFETLNQEPKNTSQTFSSLLRNSKLVDVGVPEGKIVSGRIIHVVDDDLYVDFGWKFHCVCPRPNKNASSYVRGAKVRLMIKDLELSSKFLGYDKDLTLLEANCQLLGIMQERASLNN